jgi:exopolyphosphatase/guanosine-5'-triphosphate,3'-diphosphate pyrophosphatase
MLNITKYAAIDIGSNAVRLLVSNVIEFPEEETQFRKSALVRVPIRLGEDSFTVGEISNKNRKRLIDAMKAFKLLMRVHGVKEYMACATSAIREASNGQEIIKMVSEKSGIDIQVIDGKKEAEIIAATDLHEYIEKDKSYLYVDVGGGSTELTFFSDGKVKTSRSFKLGTVRLLNEMVDTIVWKEMKKWIIKQTKDLEDINLIGSGGNINKIQKLSGKNPTKPLSFVYMNSQYQYLQQLSYDDRIRILGLNADRADVIIPAIKIYLSAMKWSNAQKIYVPKIGLADGIIKNLYNIRHTSNK